MHNDILEICYCVKGKQQYMIGNKVFDMCGNDILIVSPNTRHSTGEYPEDKGELFWIQVYTREALGKLCNLPSLQSEYLLGCLIKKSHRLFKGAFHLRFLLEQLLHLLHGKNDILAQLTINQLIIQLLLQTLTLSEKEHQSIPSQRIDKIDEFLLDNIYRKVYVDELAKLAGISIGHFKVWFKGKTGITPKEYANRLKIEQAKVDLLKKKTVTRVAFDLGFGSSQYFSTVFKKFTGQTPSSFVSDCSRT